MRWYSNRNSSSSSSIQSLKMESLKLESLKTKNKKLHWLLKSKKQQQIQYKVPIVNLSNHELSRNELRQLQLGLEYSFIDKNKNQKTRLAANLETIAQKSTKFVKNEEKENFHHFLRTFTNKFVDNVKQSKNYTYHNLHPLINDQSTLVMSGDKDSCVVILNRDDYVAKFENMIQDGINNGTYKLTVDSTIKDLQKFQNFLYRNFGKYEHYDKMRPISNKTAKLYGTAKTHKFSNTVDIKEHLLKFRPIIDQTGTMTYNAAKVIGNYLKPLAQSEYIIRDTQTFPDLIKSLPPLAPDEEYVSYDVDSLFTNIPLEETINYIIDQIYVHKKLKPIASKLVFKRLLWKITTDCTFQFNGKFYKQIDGCAMGGPLSVILADICMIKMENDIVRPHNPIFYKRFVDDIITRRKIGVHDELYEALNKYHPKLKLTIEVNPSKFLDTSIKINNNNTISTSVHMKETKLPIPWSSKVPKRYKRNAVVGDLHRAKRIGSDFEQEVSNIKTKYRKADFPQRYVDSIIRQFAEEQQKATDSDSFLIPPGMFDEEEEKGFLLVEIPFCEKNEILLKTFLKKFDAYTNSRFRVSVKWLTKKTKTLFPLKDRNTHPACKVYEGLCSCGVSYVGETKRNVEQRWSEHRPPHRSEPANHLEVNPTHSFTWKVINDAPLNDRERKNLEALIIAIKRPVLNEQVDSNLLCLFRFGIT